MINSRDVASTEFPTVKWRAGYEIDEVKDLLASVTETLKLYETGQKTATMLTAHELGHMSFQPTKFRAGWGQLEVDRYLREVVATLAEYERLRG